MEFINARGANSSCQFFSVFEENEGRPEFDFERPAETPSWPVFDFEVKNTRLLCKCLLDDALRRAAVTAPVRAELQNRGSGDVINLLACQPRRQVFLCHG